MNLFVTKHYQNRARNRFNNDLYSVLIDIYFKKNAVEMIENTKISFITYQKNSSLHKIYHVETKTLLLFSAGMDSLLNVNFQNKAVLKVRRSQNWKQKIKIGGL